MACGGTTASHVCWPALPLSPFPWSPLCLPGWGCWYSHRDMHMHQPVPSTLCHVSLVPYVPHALSLAQPQEIFPEALHIKQLTATAVPRALVLSCRHPFRAARSHPQDSGWGTQPRCVRFWGSCPLPSLLVKGGTATTQPPPQAVSAPAGCPPQPGFRLPHVPADAFWGHRITETRNGLGWKGPLKVVYSKPRPPAASRDIN